MADDQLSRAFAALGDPTRRGMLARLAVGDATVAELAEPFDVSVQAVSKHVRVLAVAGLVTQSRDAQRRPCHLEAEVFDLMTKWIERYRRQAQERYERLDVVLADMRGERPIIEPTRTRSSVMTTSTHHQVSIEADPHLPIIRMIRDFDVDAGRADARPHRSRAVRTLGRTGRDGHRDHRLGRHDRRTLALCRRRGRHGVRLPRLLSRGRRGAHRADVHLRRPARRRRTETLRFEHLGGSRTGGCTAESLVDSFESRDAWLASGMETGVDQGYAKLDVLIVELRSGPCGPYCRVAGAFTTTVEGVRDDGWDQPAPVRRMGRPRRGGAPRRDGSQRSSTARPASRCHQDRRSPTTPSGPGAPRPTQCKPCSTSPTLRSASTTSRTWVGCRSGT